MKNIDSNVSKLILPTALSATLTVLVVNAWIYATRKGFDPFIVALGSGIVLLGIYLARNPTVVAYPFNKLVETLEEKHSAFYSSDEKLKIFPQSRDFELSWSKIRDEALTMKYGSQNIGKTYLSESDNWWKGWDTCVFREFGKDNKENLNKCPIIKEILDGNVNITTAFLSKLSPGKIIKPHKGPYKGILRYHIALQVPNDGDVFINVDGQKYNWTEGEGVLFDETYRHYVQNNSSGDRVILFVDVLREFKTPILNKLNKFNMQVASMYGF